jgi:hypothetical protein
LELELASNINIKGLMDPNKTITHYTHYTQGKNYEPNTI